MSRSNVNRLTDKEQRELLRLLEDEQKNTLILLHNVPRPERPGEPARPRTAQGHYIVGLPIGPR